jgi:hypothetical protein
MAGEVQAQKRKLVGNVALKLKRSTAMKRAKRDPIGLRLCVNFGR